MRQLLFYFLFLIMTGCNTPSFNSICEEKGIKRPCKDEELQMISGMNKIMDDLNFEPKLFKNFLQVKNGQNPTLFLFGESHLAVIGQVETLAAINFLVQKGDVILLEGRDKNKLSKFESCAHELIYKIYTMNQYQISHHHYDPFQAYSFIKKNFLKTYQNTKKSYEMGKFNLSHLQCFYWDDEQSLNDDRITYRNMKKRNRSMIEAIKKYLSMGHRVFVIAGYGHLPLGDALSLHQNKTFISYFDHLQLMNEFYERQKTKNYPAGSSRILHRFLKRTEHHQFININMFKNDAG